jgi:hypothetical protein
MASVAASSASASAPPCCAVCNYSDNDIPGYYAYCNECACILCAACSRDIHSGALQWHLQQRKEQQQQQQQLVTEKEPLYTEIPLLLQQLQPPQRMIIMQPASVDVAKAEAEAKAKAKAKQHTL